MTLAPLLLVMLLTVRCATTSSSFRASVIDFSPEYIINATNAPVSRSEALRVMWGNMDRLEAALLAEIGNGTDKATKPLDIVVFPEDSLFGTYFPERHDIFPYLETIPGPNPSLSLCNDSTTHPVLSRLACVAARHSTYLVASMGTVQLCSQSPRCPTDGRFQFNTAVALDRKGALVSRYYKAHLFQERQWDAGSRDASNLAWFETDFGARVGMLVCFDVLFEWPTSELLSRGVSVFALPSWWLNFQTIITATQTQQAFSRARSATLLAAGTGLSYFNSGSGIYHQGEALGYAYNPSPNPMTQLVSVDVPLFLTPTSDLPELAKAPGRLPALSDPFARELENSWAQIPSDWNATLFAATAMSQHDISASFNGFTCRAKVKVGDAGSPAERFGVFAFSNISQTPAVQVCGIVRCSSATPRDCLGWIHLSTTRFTHLELWLDPAPSGGKLQWQVLPMVAASNFTLVEPKVLVPSSNSQFSSWRLSRPLNLLNVAVWRFGS